MDISTTTVHENLLMVELSSSILLMTSSLFFFHMTKVKSLEINPIASSLFSVFLILLAILIVVNSLLNYHYKISKNINQEEQSMINRQFFSIYLSIGIIFICIQFCIACSIIIGIL